MSVALAPTPNHASPSQAPAQQQARPNGIPKVPSTGILSGASPAATSGKASRRKQRCWIFHVTGITRDVKEPELLSSVRERYTTVKRLVVTPAKPDVTHTESKNVLVEVQFTGPQPSEGPGSLLCDLLCGVGVDARPVELPRGRKKRARTGAASPEASDSDGEDAKKNTVTSTMDNPQGEDKAGKSAAISNAGGHDDAATPRKTLFSAHPGGDQEGRPPASSSQSPAPQQQAATADVAATAAVDARAAATNERVMQQLRMNHTSPHQRDAQPPQQAVGVQQPPPPPPQEQQQQQAPQQQQVQRGLSGTGQQWDDVVRRMTSPPVGGQGASRSNISSTHSLDVSSVDLCSPRSSGVKHEFEPFLLASQQGSSGHWTTQSDGGGGLLSPMPAPQSGAPLRGGWSFDTTPIGDGEFSSGNIMDLADVDNLFRSGDCNSTVNGAPSRHQSGISTTSADAGAGGKSQETGSARWMSDSMSMEKVMVEPSRKEVDFEGCAASATSALMSGRSSGSLSARAAASLASAANQCHLVFSGLDRTGVDLRSLTVTAHFGVDSVHKVTKVAGPIQVGANGRTFASVYYPSMREIWPDLYSTANIRVVEVDVVVEVRSEGGEFQYVGPHLKVTYLRAPVPVEDGQRRDAGAASRRIRHANQMSGRLGSVDEGPNVSYSCVDYSCGDWFAEMCQSVFRGSSNSHQPLEDDSSHDIMSVDA